MRKWIPQPTKKNVCGQIAVAVITGITLEESIKLVGKKGCTRTQDIVKALSKKGYRTDLRCGKKKPKLGLGQLHMPKRNGWHWVVVDGDKIFDGVWGTPDGKVEWPEGWRITSYLGVYDK